jgi:hypothetical protein
MIALQQNSGTPIAAGVRGAEVSQLDEAAMFMTAWLPNIACTVLGCVVSGLIGFWQARRVAQDSEKHTRMLTNLLVVMEERGYLKLARNAKGEVTGGRAYELRAAAIVTTTATAELTTAPTSPAS